MIICSNCGGKFQEELSRCPYCGQIYVPGAEREYMEELQDIKEGLSEVEEASAKIYQKEINSTIKKTRVIIFALIAVALLGCGLFWSMDHLFSYEESEEEIKKRMLWQHENLPVVEEWYDACEYQKILDFMEQAYEEYGYSLYDWEHYHFINHYEHWQICMDIHKRILAGEEVSEFDAGELLYCGMSVMFYENENSGYALKSYGEDDIKQLNRWKQDVETIFYDTLQYSKQELEELTEELYKEGFLSYEACRKYRKDILDRTYDE